MKAFLFIAAFCLALSIAAQAKTINDWMGEDTLHTPRKCVKPPCPCAGYVYPNGSSILLDTGSKIPAEALPAIGKGQVIKASEIPVSYNAKSGRFKPIPKDTIIVKDTIVLAAYEVYDTSKKALMQMWAFGGITRVRKGFVVLRGFAYRNGGQFVWSEQPQLHTFLNRRKRPIKRIIQIL